MEQGVRPWPLVLTATLALLLALSQGCADRRAMPVAPAAAYGYTPPKAPAGYPAPNHAAREFSSRQQAPVVPVR
jgi:hypothetical protein